MTSARAVVEEQKNVVPSAGEEQKTVGPSVGEEQKNIEPSVGTDIKPIAKFDPATIENPPEALIDAPVGGSQI